MLVQISTLRGVDAPAGFTDHVETLLNQSLDRFAPQITRVEAHFGDVNGGKGGPNDKRCSLEARLAGHQPLAAVGTGETIEAAFNGAVDKLEAVITHTVDRLRDPSHAKSSPRNTPIGE